MFKIVEQRRAWWPVKLDVVGEDGELLAQSFDLRFNLFKVDDFHDMMEEAATAEEQAGQEGTVRRSEILAGVVLRLACDWRGVTQDDGTAEGKALSWTDEHVRMLLNEPGVYEHILLAFRDCISARAEIRAGN